MSSSNRKCFSSIPSSFASIYLITAFFAISFLSLLYIKYPQQINNFEYLRIINLNPTTRTTTNPLSVNDFPTPSVSLLKEVDVNAATNPTTSPLLSDSEFPPPSVVEFPPPKSTAFAQGVNDEQLPPPPVVETPVPNLTEVVQEDKDGQLQQQEQPPVADSPVNDDAVNLSVAPAATVVEEAESENHDQTPSSLPPATNTEEENKNNNKDDSGPVPAAVIQTAEKQEEDEEDEAGLPSVDHLSFPPINNSSEERMAWIKQKLPESRLLESTASTRKFDEKMQQFISTKRCRVNIFMTWISPTRYFGKREMFSLESVLKAHPGGCVIIISRIMASKPGREMIQPLIERGHLILPIVPDFPLLFTGTPAHDWLERLKAGQIDPGKIPITQNLSNLLRLVILYKYGGVYLDTDMIILKDVSGLRNTIGVQELDEKKKIWVSVNNAVLVFDKEHPLLFRFMEEFNSTFDGSLWGHNGPYMASRVIKKSVHDSRYQFNMMSPVAFYPVDWFKIHKFFRNPKGNNDTDWTNDMFNKVSRESYGVHLWNKISIKMRIEKDSIIGRLISDHCIICKEVYSS
ncbi:hypothetical protein SOVF_205670 [Spinacia oleracea]|uniref:Alpha 1,4-glycosyltransferase domain-containing protein n=1 Tax=Spinacia oleracea TaxID=3562 RepID=A0A9R0IFF9_SPIOL|nr:uncharacterized protein LOC110788017 [Spinacia oleracea]XP_056699084.1 uncharacterized protein LOC110788017 [Spinacia oleracea]KNA03798.1 hypothetical protein SOVF_205670 [Spinacia oleracea]